MIASSLHLTGNPLLDMALEQRGILDKDEIDYSLKGLLPINSLSQVELLAQHLFNAIKENKRIVIIADYDCDGATSCALMVRMLMSLKANVGWLVPDRSIHGYGLTKKIVEEAYQGIVTGDAKSLTQIEEDVKKNTFTFASENLDLFHQCLSNDKHLVEKTTLGNKTSEKPDIILTVDNGIASVEGVEYAQSLGLEVLITDHHLAGKTLPKATAIVNPNHPECNFKSKALCGVGVAWYVCAKLHQIAKENKQESLSPAKLLPLVALGTVADVVSLDKNNRILVENGLTIIRNQPTFIGIDMLLHISAINKQTFNSTDIGFQIGPRINAAGRIKHMGVGILNLITDDQEVAFITAMQLQHLNELRKEITKNVTEESELILKTSENRDFSHDYVIVLHPEEDETWHEGVIGIVAGRIKEKYNKPSIVLTYLEDEHLYKGSCRSIPSLHFKDLLDAVALEDENIFMKYGGHAMAAGLSIYADKLDDFISIINKKAREVLTTESFVKHKISDGELRLDQLNLTHVKQLQAAVWGQNFPYPQFNGRYLVIGKKRMGTEQQHVKLTLKQGNTLLDAVRFNCPDFDPPIGKNINILFQPTVNEWNDYENVNLLIQEADFEKDELIKRIDVLELDIKEDDNNQEEKPTYFYQLTYLSKNTIPDFD